MNKKRILAMADTHCGHLAGLTPPSYWWPESGPYGAVGALQRELWKRFEQGLKNTGPFDGLLCLGDFIDGRGERSGSTELITSDRLQQCAIASACINAVPLQDSASIIMVTGTPYHTGSNGEDYEHIIAENVGAHIGGHEWAECYGVVFDLKHKIGSSQIPHGRHTAMAREKLWNTLWAQRGYALRADIILRAHVHYYAECGGVDWWGATCPSLQGPGSKYGVTQCSGEVHWGFLYFDIWEDGTWIRHKDQIWEVETAKPKAVSI